MTSILNITSARVSVCGFVSLSAGSHSGDTRSSKAGVVGSCQVPGMEAGECHQTNGKEEQQLFLLGTLSGPKTFDFK